MPENEALTKFLAAMTEILTGAKDFVIEQVPDVLRQWLAWGMVDAVTGIVGGCLLVIGALVCWRIVHKIVKRGRERPCPYPGLHSHQRGKPTPTSEECGECDLLDIGGPVVVLPMILGVTLLLVGLCTVWGNARDAIKIHVAPKVWLIEQFRNAK